MKKFKYKIFATIILFSMLINLFSGFIYANNYISNVENNVEQEEYIDNNLINNEADNKINDETNNVVNDVDNNSTVGDNVIDENNTIIDNSTTENITKKENTTKEDKTKDNEIENNIIEEQKSSDENLNVLSVQENNGIKYKTHVQYYGWQDWKENGELAGTSGQSLRLEAINIQLTGDIASKVKIKYKTHVQYYGWQDWKENGELAGTSGQGLRLEAIKIQLDYTDDYSVMYRVHVQNIGWQDWKTDGEMAGTSGQALRLEAIEIKIVKKNKKGIIHIDTPQNGGKTYENSVKISGWKMANIYDSKVKIYIDNNSDPISEKSIVYKKRNDVLEQIVGYGNEIENVTPGFETTLNVSNMKEGKHTITVYLIDSNGEVLQGYLTNFYIDRGVHTSYNSHIQNIGWQGDKYDGDLSGTSGQALRLEAISMRLYGVPSNTKILYKAHVQSIGWQNWAQDGSVAGTQGAGLRIEALQIKLQNLDGYTVEYQVHVQGIGWTDWYIDGETAGTVGQGRRIEAIRIRIVSKYKHQYNGIDVSQFNGIINWGNVKRSGMDFAMLRVGFRGYGKTGNLREDANFRTNIQLTNKLEIPTGVYFVTQAITEAEAIEEANFVIEKIKGYNIKYPVAIDIEYPKLESESDVPRTQNLDKNTRTYLAKVFCQIIQNAGYTPMIYCNIDWATNYLNMSELSQYDTWIAHYRDVNLGPNYSGNYSIWQYTSSGSVIGVLGNVDLNICYKKY